MSWVFLLAAWGTAALHFWESLRFFSVALRDWKISWPSPQGIVFIENTFLTLTSAGIALAFLWGAAFWGRVLRTRRFQNQGLALNNFENLGTGLLLFYGVGLALTAAGLSSAPLIKFLGLFLIGFSLLFIRTEAHALGLSLKRLLLPGGPPRTFLWVFALLLFANAALPDTFVDTLQTVLPDPSAWLREGHWTSPVGGPVAALPSLSKPLFLWMIPWGEERPCLFFNVFLCLAWASGLASRAEKGEKSWVALFFLSIPMVALYAGSATNEILCGYYLTWAYFALVETPPTPSHFFKTGLALGAAFTAKHTAILALPFFSVWIFLQIHRRPKPLSAVFAMATGTLLPYLPWTLHNLWTFGQPFFPYGENSPFFLEILRGEQQGNPLLWERVRAFFISATGGLRYGRYSYVGPILLLGALFFLAAHWKSFRSWKKGNPLLLFLGTSLAGAILVSSHVRYAIPFFGLLALGSARLFVSATAGEGSRPGGPGPGFCFWPGFRPSTKPWGF